MCQTGQVQEQLQGTAQVSALSNAGKGSYSKALQVFSLLNQQFVYPSQTRGLVVKSIPLPLSQLWEGSEHRDSAPGQIIPVPKGSRREPSHAQCCSPAPS